MKRKSRKVKQIGNIDVSFQGSTDEPIAMCDVSYVSFVPYLGFNILSFHKAQESHNFIFDSAGSQIIRKNIKLPRVKNRLYLRARGRLFHWRFKFLTL